MDNQTHNELAAFFKSTEAAPIGMADMVTEAAPIGMADMVELFCKKTGHVIISTEGLEERVARAIFQAVYMSSIFKEGPSIVETKWKATEQSVRDECRHSARAALKAIGVE